MYVLLSKQKHIHHFTLLLNLLVFAYLHGHSRALDTGREKVKGLDAMNGRGGKTSASLTEDKERERRHQHAWKLELCGRPCLVCVGLLCVGLGA